MNAASSPPPLSQLTAVVNAEHMVNFQRALCRVADETYRLLDECNQGERAVTPSVRAQLEQWYVEWSETLAFEHGFYGEIQSFVLPDGRAVMGSYSMQVFVEVCRVHYLLELDKWRAEHEALLLLQGPAPNPSQYEVLWCISMCAQPHWIEDEWPAWDVPVARYTQSQVHATLLVLSRVLLNFPDASSESMTEFNRLAHVLMTHNARFFSVCNASKKLVFLCMSNLCFTGALWPRHAG